MKTFLKSRFSVVNYKLFDFIIIALFIALEIVFDRFLSINQWNIKIGIGFLPTAIIAYRYGATGAIITAAMSDFIGAILFPFGPYYFPFTAAAAINGLILGLFLYRNRRFINVFLSAFLSGTICTLLLNTHFICTLYGGNFIAIMTSRLPQFAFTLVAEIILFRYLYVFDLAFGKNTCKSR